MDGATFYESLAQWSEVVGGFAFVVVAVVLFRRFVLPAVRAGQAAKNHELIAAEQRRERLRAEAAQARAEVEAAEREALAIVERGRTDALRERDRIIAEAHAEAHHLLRNAEGELARARFSARDHLRIEFIEQALQRARTLAAERIDERTDARLIAKTVDDLTAGKAR
jgi:F0F1-type ATP synthase membrane subunit b/b'